MDGIIEVFVGATDDEENDLVVGVSFREVECELWVTEIELDKLIEDLWVAEEDID